MFGCAGEGALGGFGVNERGLGAAHQSVVTVSATGRVPPRAAEARAAPRNVCCVGDTRLERLSRPVSATDGPARADHVLKLNTSHQSLPAAAQSTSRVDQKTA